MAKVTKKSAKKRVKKNVQHGQAHIQSSFNNTIVTLTVSIQTKKDRKENSGQPAYPCGSGAIRKGSL